MKGSFRKTKLPLASLVAVNLTLASMTLAPVTEAKTTNPNAAVQAQQKAGLPAAPITAFLVDKARYNPKEKVTMSILFDTSKDWKGKLNLEVYHLNEKVAEGTKNIKVKKGLKGIEVEWTPPAEDFRGYLSQGFDTGF